jgi:TRAP-type C4-dicarboxylate transport system permease small subunit
MSASFLTPPDAHAAQPAARLRESSGSGDAMPGLLDSMSTWFHWMGAVLLALMMAIICCDAVARVVFNSPFEGTTEIVAALVVVVTSLQLPYVLIRGLLLRVTFVLDALPAAYARLLDALAYAVGFAFFAAISTTSIHPLLNSISKSEYEGTMSFQIPLWPLRLTTLVLWALSAAICLALVVDGIGRARRGAASRAQEDTLA